MLKIFNKIINVFDRYTEWKLVQFNVPGILNVDGEQIFRLVDTYERYDKLNNVYERKLIYNEPTKFIMGL